MLKARSVATATLVAATLLTARSLKATSPAVPELAGTAAETPGPLATEIERWSKRLAAETSADPLWADVKEEASPLLARAEQALRDHRPLLALLRLASARETLAAGAWLLERPQEARRDVAGFEAEWARMGVVLRPSLGALSEDALSGVRPALARALGEASLHQVRVYYEASLEYGRGTTSDSGLFYLGAAQAQADFASLSRPLGAALPPTEAANPRELRSLDPELDALESEMLSAYRPPASIEKHPQFIAASSALKTARELNAAGLRHGALLRYLQAVLRFAAVREPDRPPKPPSAGAPLEAAAFARKREENLARLSLGDHSVGQVFLEAADAELASDPTAGAATATAVVEDVLPRYFAALGPAAPRVARPEPRATVTLVRWPYT